MIDLENKTQKNMAGDMSPSEKLKQNKKMKGNICNIRQNQTHYMCKFYKL